MKNKIDIFFRAYRKNDELVVYEIVIETGTKIILNQIKNPAFNIYHTIEEKIDKLIEKYVDGEFVDYKLYNNLEQKKIIKKLYYKNVQNIKKDVTTISINYKAIENGCSNCQLFQNGKCIENLKVPKKSCKSFVQL